MGLLESTPVTKLRLFCPFCGAPDERLTYGVYYDKFIRRYVVDCFCNACEKAFIIVELEKEEVSE